MKPIEAVYHVCKAEEGAEQLLSFLKHYRAMLLTGDETLYSAIWSPMAETIKKFVDIVLRESKNAEAALERKTRRSSLLSFIRVGENRES